MTANERLAQDLRAAGITVKSLWELGTGDTRYPEATPILVRWLERIDEWSDADDTRSLLEESIVETLGLPNLRQQARRLAVPALIKRFRECRSDTVRWTIGDSLGLLAGPKFYDEIVSLTRDRRYGTARAMIVYAIYKWRDPRVIPVLISLLEDGDVAAPAASALGRMRAREGTVGLIALAWRGTPLERSECIRALSRMWSAAEALKLATDPGNESAGKVLVKELWRWKDASIVPALVELLDDTNLAADAALSLGRLKAKEAETRLGELILSGSRAERRAAEVALRRISPAPPDPNKPHPDAWFRSPNWDEASRELFEKKLARARPSRRPQYLRIKGYALTGTDDPRTITAGRALLNQVIAEYPDEWPMETAGAYFGLGGSFAREGRHDEAIRQYEKCLEVEDGRSSYGAELRLAEVIVEAGRVDRDDQALRVLADFVEQRQGFYLNDELWRLEIARARLLKRLADESGASDHAKAALKLLGAKPQFYRHPDVGLVEADAATVAEMEVLAGGWPRVLRG